MIKRRCVLKLMAAPAVMTLARPGFAKEKVTYAYLLDPAYDAVTWAMTNGKVASDLITVEARGLAIPQLIQDLLLLARGDSGRLGESQKPLSVRALVEQAQEKFDQDEMKTQEERLRRGEFGWSS